jgi:hypothetical protein
MSADKPMLKNREVAKGICRDKAQMFLNRFGASKLMP